MPIRIIDTETTGLDPSDGAEVIEMASVDLTKEFGITNELQTFIKPSKPVPYNISGVTGIIDADLEEAPTFDQAFPQFMADNLTVVAHNLRFDLQFLPAFQGLPGICTMKAARRLWDLESYTNQSIRYFLGLVEPFGIKRHTIDPHRALSDVIVTAGILAHILQNRLATYRQLVDWTEAPTYFRTVPIGKFKGQPWSAAEASYLDWLLKSDMDADIKVAAADELQRRRKAA